MRYAATATVFSSVLWLVAVCAGGEALEGDAREMKVAEGIGGDKAGEAAGMSRLLALAPQMGRYGPPMSRPDPPVSRPGQPGLSSPEEDPFVAELNMLGGKRMGRGACGSWSPDATRLAFGRTPIGAGVRIFNTQTNKMTTLVFNGKYPAWSPQEGYWIAYVHQAEQGDEIWLVEAAGGTPRRLAEGVFPSWSADATTVRFFSPKTRQLMAIRIDPPSAEPVVLWEAPFEHIPAAWYPSISPDGRYVAYLGNGQLEVVDLESSQPVWVRPLRGWRGLLARWSPDGKRLGFGAFGGQDKDLWILDTTSGHLKRVISGWCTLPAWSSDGSKFLFDFRSKLRGYEIWILDASVFSRAATVAEAKDRVDAPKFGAFDGFEGKLELKWEPLRHDPTHVSLTKNPGNLTIRSQKGSIRGTDNAVLAKNLFLVDNPVPAGDGFVLTTCIEAFRATIAYQQAGLICYDDDDNYLEWGCERSWRPGGGTHFCLVLETDGRPAYDPTDGKPNTERFWLRLTKRGNRYEYSSSADGRNFVVHGDRPWGGGAPRRIGILAKNGPDEEANQIDARFDFFELRPLTVAERYSALEVERQNLEGTWKVVSCQRSGEPLKNGAPYEFVFARGRVAVREGTEAIETDYELDITTQPKQLVLSTLIGAGKRSVRSVYNLQGNTLTICLDPRPDAPAPSDLETREGDGRLLTTLKRVRPRE